MIEDGENGYLVSQGDVESMAERIVKILSDPELRQRMSDNAPKTLKKFSQPVIAEQWAKLFCTLMNRSDEQ